MYQGYPDFQHIIITDNQRLIASYQQAGNWYIYPQTLAILDEQPLAFALDIVRSYSQEIIYGRLSFTPVLQYASRETLTDFSRDYPADSVQILCVQPGYLLFSPPQQIAAPFTAGHYEAAWYSVQDIQFMLLLDKDNTQLLERTLLDGIVGFAARMDGFVTGVAPRLDYNVSCDPAVLIASLAAGIKESHALPDGRIAFDYAQLSEYLFEHLTLLPLQFEPRLNDPDTALVRLLSAALLDRLFNRFGAPLAGSAENNQCWISLEKPAAGREIFELQREVLTQRPLCFQFDPFGAAQQIAKVKPDDIIHRVTAPALPQDELAITLVYVWPDGLIAETALDVQITIPAGNLYPQPQSRTQPLRPGKSELQFVFRNNSYPASGSYHYQLLLNVPATEGYLKFVGEKRSFSQPVDVVDYRSLPVSFFRLTAENDLLHSSKLTGEYRSGDLYQTFVLSVDNPSFSAPCLSENSEVRLAAHQTDGSGVVNLPGPVTQSGRIGLSSFPQYGPHQATIRVQLAESLTSAMLCFISEEGYDEDLHVFTHQQDEFIYHWRVTSLFHPRFRYRIGEEGPWSAWVTEDQNLFIGAEE